MKELNLIQPYPKECSVVGCSEDTQVIYVVAVNPNGITEKTHGSKALFKNSGNYQERQGYEFINWITRCAECYLREMDYINKGSDPVYQKSKSLRQTNPELFYTPVNDQDRLDFVEMHLKYIKRAAAKITKLPYDKRTRVRADYNEQEALSQLKKAEPINEGAV